jgi:Tfp pilus assembly protein PilF
LTRDAFEAAVTPVAQRYARVIAYGSSLGAYAALYFGRDQPWTVIASSPRVSVHPEFGDPSWQQRGTWQHERFRADRQARCHAVILYDPYDRIDRNYLRGEVLQQFPHAEVMRIPFAGHPVNNFLGDIGFIAPYVRAVVAGEPPPQLQRRAHRVRSANYHQVLALLCVQRGHVTWAEPLARRAVELAPTRMLMQRTMGLVQLEQGRWSEAQATLETALALSPDDPYTIALLARAQAGPQARQHDTQSGWLRRAGQRLRRLVVRR